MSTNVLGGRPPHVFNPPWFLCKVNAAGPAADGTETTEPVIYLNLTDLGGTFANYWFYAAENSRSQMLAVALNAITLQTTVAAKVVQPNANNLGYTQLLRIYLKAA